MTRVLIVDDQRTARHMMEHIIEASDGRYELVESIENAGLAELYCAGGNIDLVLMDVYTAGRENGIEAAAKIKSSFPHIKVIIVTSLPEESFIRRAKKANCDSFWYKDLSSHSLIEIMDKTMNGERIFPLQTPNLEIGNAKSVDFTEKEIEVIRALIAGRTYQEVSESLYVSKSTVKYHINNILSKTGYTSTVKLLIDIAEQKFIIPDF